MLTISFLSFIVVSFITSYTYNTYFLGILIGRISLIFSFIAYYFYKGTIISRLIFGIVFMIYPAIMVQQQLGMIEMHFAFFFMASFLMMYKDISPVLIALIVVSIHHIMFTYLQLNNLKTLGEPIVIFSINCSWTITHIHMSMWFFALLIYIYSIHRNSQNFIKMHLNAITLKQQTKKIQTINLTLEKR